MDTVIIVREALVKRLGLSHETATLVVSSLSLPVLEAIHYELDYSQHTEDIANNEFIQASKQQKGRL